MLGETYMMSGGETGRGVNATVPVEGTPGGSARPSSQGRPAPGASDSARPFGVVHLLPGPKYLARYLLALPATVMCAASVGSAQLISGLVAATWLVLAPVALHARWASRLLPICSGAYLAATILFLPFSSAVFAVDLTSTVVMFVVSFPSGRLLQVEQTPPTGGVAT